MDPASAIGIASGAIAFLQFSYQFVRAIRDAYDDSRPSAYEVVGDVAQQMKEQSLQLLSQSKTSPPLSKDELAILALATHCQKLADNIFTRTERTKATGGRRRDAIAAAIKTLINKGEIDRLQVNLDSCRAQLHLHFQLSSSQKILESLSRMEEASDSLRRMGNQKNVLMALRRSIVDDRFHEVSDPASTTFEWIFETSDTGTASTRPVLPLNSWLSSGQGIFHIAGKPGSGKSTLMKFLYKHSRTSELLHHWANGKTLVTARFFFWKPGVPIQKNLAGLVQSLLYYVLSQITDYIEIAFPNHWDPSHYQSWHTRPVLNIEKDEIFSAFEVLIKCHDIYKDNRFCFFIDGLDEFEESLRTHRDLVNFLQSWVDVSAGGVKICVSSRELPPFEKRLPINQKIRLQNLTKDDITQFVAERLHKESYFQELRVLYPTECENLEKEIVKRSDGVFLWVAVILNSICDGFDYEESPAELLQKLYSFPQDLEAFFQHVLESIPKERRKQAYSTLAFAIKSNNFGEPLDQTWSVNKFLFSSSGVYRYWLLHQYLQNPNFAAGSLQRMTGHEINRCLSLAATQVTGRCFGLLELRLVNVRKAEDANLDQSQLFRVVFTHRSIPEFLGEALQADQLKFMGDFDAIGAMIYTLIATVKYISGVEASPMDEYISTHLMHLCGIVYGSGNGNMSRYFQPLDELQKVISAQINLHRSLQDTDGASLKFQLDYLPFDLWVNFSAACIGFHEYILWGIENGGENITSTQGPVLLYAAIRNAWSVMEFHAASIQDPNVVLQRISTTVQTLLRLGVDANSRNYHTPGKYTTWSCHLANGAFYEPEDKKLFWLICEHFLEYGAYPPAFYRVSPTNSDTYDGNTNFDEFRETTEDSERGEVILRLGQEEFHLQGAYDPILHTWQQTHWPKSILEYDRVTTLYEVLDRDPPENADAIRRLLDKAELSKVLVKSVVDKPADSAQDM